ncbi:hypothetical protein ACFV3O_15840, partial [Streptomyces albidoflavus]
MSREGRKDQGQDAPPLPEALTVEVADSHTHVDMQADSMEETLAKAASVGVTTLIQVGCDLAGSRWAPPAPPPPHPGPPPPAPPPPPGPPP